MASEKKHIPMYVHDSYFCNVNTGKLKERLRIAAKYLKELDKRLPFDAIAFTGMSGALLGPPLALKLNKPMILVRKKGASTHSFRKVEGDSAARTYIIVDDFQQTGKTARTIREAVKKFAPEAKLLGLYEAHRHDKYVGFGRINLTRIWGQEND